MTTQEFIQQLSNMDVDSYNNETRTILMTNGIQVSHSIRISESMRIDSYGKPDSLPLQMMIRVAYNDSYVMTWGAETEQDNAELAIWWRRTKNTAQAKSTQLEQTDSRTGYEILMKGL